MARSAITYTVQKTADGTPVVGGTVTITIRPGGAPATIYNSESGVGTIATNGITTTDSAGAIAGGNAWLNEGSYDMQVSGSGITTYTQHIESISGQTILALDGSRLIAASVPTAALAALSVTGAKVALQTLTKDKLEASVLPVGTIIQWWRPTTSTPLPSNWLECNGQATSTHDFVGGGTINVPDLRNKYILGADSTKAINAAGTYTTIAGGNQVGNAPGQTGQGDLNAGGSNLRDTTHVHSMPHTHDFTHSHGLQDHTHTNSTPDHLHTLSLKPVQGTSPSSIYGITTSATGASDRSLASTTSGASALSTNSQSTATTGQPSNANTGAASGASMSATQDLRPLSFGLIYLIKVKAT